MPRLQIATVWKLFSRRSTALGFRPVTAEAMDTIVQRPMTDSSLTYLKLMILVSSSISISSPSTKAGHTLFIKTTRTRFTLSARTLFLMVIVILPGGCLKTLVVCERCYITVFKFLLYQRYDFYTYIKLLLTHLLTCVLFVSFHHQLLLLSLKLCLMYSKYEYNNIIII